jgi:DNA-directed RNA polymerase subunit RPC12/RpoP
MATLTCAHCGSAILDPTTSTIHGDMTYCCTNCAAAMEQQGSGSDPQAMEHAEDLRCSHCGTPIVDESTMDARGSDPYCCTNCSQMAA